MTLEFWVVWWTGSHRRLPLDFWCRFFFYQAIFLVFRLIISTNCFTVAIIGYSLLSWRYCIKFCGMSLQGIFPFIRICLFSWCIHPIFFTFTWKFWVTDFSSQSLLLRPKFIFIYPSTFPIILLLFYFLSFLHMLVCSWYLQEFRSVFRATFHNLSQGQVGFSSI